MDLRIDPDWLRDMAEKEDGGIVSVGGWVARPRGGRRKQMNYKKATEVFPEEIGSPSPSFWGYAQLAKAFGDVLYEQVWEWSENEEIYYLAFLIRNKDLFALYEVIEDIDEDTELRTCDSFDKVNEVISRIGNSLKWYTADKFIKGGVTVSFGSALTRGIFLHECVEHILKSDAG